MFDRDKWSEIFQVLGKNLFRTIATAFGVMWGIMMLIIMLGSGNGLQRGVMSDFDRVTNCMFLWTQRTTMPYAGFNRGRWFNLRSDDVSYLKTNIPEIDVISPRNQLGGYQGDNNVVRGLKTGAYSVFGDTPDLLLIDPKPIEKGRFINWNDLDYNRKVCVIGRRVYKEMFEKDEEALGEYITINGVNFQVIGIYTSRKSGEEADEETQSVFVPFTTFQKAFNFGDVVGWMGITSKEGVPVADIEAKIVEKLKIKHKIHPDDANAFGHWNMQKEFNQMNGIFIGIGALSWFVGILTLLAGVIGVSNIMLVIIKERTSEIGVRRALGATPANVISQIILESIFLTAIAGCIGVICGVWILEGVNYMLQQQADPGAFRNPGVDFNVVFIALLVLIFSGVLAGLLPAIRAVAIKPVDALRDE